SALTVGLTTIVATSVILTVSLKGGLSAFFGLFHEDGMIIPDIPALLASGEITPENSMDIAGRELDPGLIRAVEALDVGTLVHYGFVPLPAELSTIPGAPGLFVEPEIFLPLGNFDFFEGDADSALELMQRGRAMLLMPILADRVGVGVGDVVEVETSIGPIGFTVAGIGGTSTNFTVMSYADGERYFGLSVPSWLGIVLPDGGRVDVDDMLDQVEEAIAPYKDVVVFDMRDSGVGGMFEIIDQIQVLLNALLLLAVIVAGLGVVNTVVINVAERRREIALLRAVGATQRQVRQAVVAEAAVLGMTGALVAAVLGLVFLGLFVTVFLPNGAASVGIRNNWDMAANALLPALRDWVAASLFSAVVGPVVAALAAYYPAWQAAAMNVVEATRDEQVALKKSKARRCQKAEAIGTTRAASTLARAMAWRNLRMHRARTLLSAISVGLGVAMIVATGVIQSGMRGAWESGENKMAFISDMSDVVFNGVGVIILVAAGFLIYNAFAMSVTQQQRQIGMLRSLGMTRAQVLRQVLAEAGYTGGLGTLGGLLGGPLLGRVVLAAMEQMGAQVGRGSVAWKGIVLGAAMGVGIALLSALLPARRAAQVPPLVALQGQIGKPANEPGGSPSWRFGIGILVLAILIAYLAIAPPGEWSGKHQPWDWIMVLVLWMVWLSGLGLIVPELLGGAVRVLRKPLARLGGTVGRLIGDCLTRAPGRTTLTALTFGVGLMMMVGTAGIVSFSNDVLLSRLAEKALQQAVWIIYPFNRTSGMGQISAFDMDAPGIDDAVWADVQRLAEKRAIVDPIYMVVVPEVSSPMPGFPSIVIHDLDHLRSGHFDLLEGDWVEALRFMQQGCGLLLTPATAGRHRVSVGDRLVVTGRSGLVACTVAGIGAGGFAPMTLIGPGGEDDFVAAGDSPDSLSVRPLPGTDAAVLEADLDALNAQYGDKAFVRYFQENISSKHSRRSSRIAKSNDA
ncbi:MAG: FtsX-like permease family protein, partial [Anaerolineae bacterium]|nr:FtsX-like permease family protein [Anaerolineae bacterium]